MTTLVAAGDTISVGDHPTWHFLGMTFNVDTMYTSVLGAVATLAFCFWVTRRSRTGVPTKAQVALEAVLNQAKNYTESAVGHDVPPWLVPLGFALFFFILFCNELELIPSGHHPERLGPPTADTNLTFALMVIVVIGYTFVGFRRKRHRYVLNWLTAKPLGVGAFIAIVIDQIANPVALALRLFGNVLAGGIMLAVIALLPVKWFLLFGVGNVVWKLFDCLLILPIQAFIFAFLTILYFGFATAEEH
jgi:F-type H+-transporting ATPase subunit a